MESWGPFIQLGVGGILLLVLWMIVRGELRTTQEVSTQKERTARAEGQVDKLLPAVEQNTDTLKGVVQELQRLGEVHKTLLTELREEMKDKGIGTPATRAQTIETLISREFMEREGRAPFATETGILHRMHQ